MNKVVEEPSVWVFAEKKPSLEQAQKMIGGSIELIDLSDGDQMLVDEEFLLKGLDINGMATIVANQRILGNAIILQGKAKWN
jgi:hypothetical protein